MKHTFSESSLSRIKGLHPSIQKVLKTAIWVSRVDFSVVSGLRTLDEQKALVASGKSQTLKSKHLKGRAVDLAPWIDGESKWAYAFYDDLFCSMRLACEEWDVQMRWGGAWHIPDIRKWDHSAGMAVDSYVENFRLLNGTKKEPFIDACHWELMP